jgi:hypothetical protein
LATDAAYFECVKQGGNARQSFTKMNPYHMMKKNTHDNVVFNSSSIFEEVMLNVLIYNRFPMQIIIWFLLVIFCAPFLKAQPIDFGTGLSTAAGIGGYSFELSFQQHIELHTIKNNFSSSASGDITGINVFYRKGGVHHSTVPGVVPVVDSVHGWVNLGVYPVTPDGNTLSLIPTDLPIDHIFSPGTYGIFLEPYPQAPRMRAAVWDSISPFTFSNGTITIETGEGTTYNGYAPFISGSGGRSLQFSGSVVYTPYTPLPNDLSIYSMDSTEVENCPGSKAVVVTLRNLGSNPITSATINWSVDGVLQTPYQFSGFLDTANASNPFKTQLAIGTFNLSNPQGHQVKVWTSSPNGSVDSRSSNDTAQAEIFPSLQGGTYTINPSGSGSNNFVSFAAAARALNKFGICGPITFSIAPGVYTDHIYLGEVIGSSAQNTITFDGQDSALVKLTYSSTLDTATVFLQGADYVKVKNMTISNTANTDAWGALLQNQANHNTFDNCLFLMPITTSTDVIAILASSSMSGENPGNNAHYLTVSNCTFIGGESALSLDGGGNSEEAAIGHIIRNNKFRFQDDHAMDMDGIGQILITGNDIDSLMNSSADAVYLNDIDNYEISYNRIVSPDWCLRVTDGNDGLAVSARSKILNNMLVSYTDRALYILDVENTDIFYNTAKGQPGLYLGDQLKVDIRNNIFYAEMGFGAEILDAFTSTDILDYNIYYSVNAAPIEYAGVSYTTLQEWHNIARRYNQHSIFGDPFFIGGDDLHLQGYFADGRADVSVSVPDDLDGDIRSATFPDIGADEFTPLGSVCDSVTGLILNTIGATTANISFDKDGDTYQIEYGTCQFLRGTGTMLSGTGPFSLSGLQPESCYEVYVRRLCSAPANYTSWEGPYPFTTLCGGPLSGTYTIDKNQLPTNTNFTSFTEVSERLLSCGISGPVVFNVSGDTYNEYMVLYEVAGNDAINTITFNGQDTATTVISHDGSMNPAVIELAGADYVTLNKIKIQHTGSSSSDSYGVWLRNKSDHFSISNCAITMPSLVSSFYSYWGIYGAASTSSPFGHYVSIYNNVFTNSAYGIRLYGGGGGSAQIDSVISIHDNRFTDVASRAVDLAYIYDVEVYNNYVNGIGFTRNIASPSYTKSGLRIALCDKYDVYSNQMEVYGFGLTVSSLSQNTPWRNRVTNNMVYSNSTGESPALIVRGNNVDVLHNSIRSKDSLAAYITADNGIVSDMVMKNNIFVSDSSISIHFLYSSVGWSNVSLDHNVYFNNNNDVLVSIRNQGDYLDLGSWQAAQPTQNMHSVSIDPQFVSLKDLHASAPGVNNGGTAVGILTDFDGDVRSNLFPDIGADEFMLPCTVSTNGLASSITPTNAQLSWSSVDSTAGRMFNLEYGPSGFLLGSGTKLLDVTNPYLLTGLTSGTMYDFYIQDSCGTDGTSAWAGPFTFTTAGTAPCMPSSILGADQSTSYGARLYWSGGDASNWNVEYGPTGFVPGSGTLLYNAFNDTITLTTLSSNSCYDFYVQDSCGLGYVSTWSGPHNFCTQTCVAPTALGADQLATFNARLFWTTGGATNWNVEYGPTGYNLGSGTYVYNVQNDTINIAGLFNNSCYDFYVQDSCGLNSTSSWSGPYNFCTPGCNLNAGSDSSIAVCLTDPQFDLTPYLGSHDAGGTWVDMDNNGSLAGSFVVFGSGSVAGTFRVGYYVSQAGCPNDTAIITIDAQATPNAGTGGNTQVCDTVSLDLNSLLSGQDAGGIWVDADNSGGLTGSMVDFSQVAHSNTYVYHYVVISAGCGNDTASVSVKVDSCKIGLAELGIIGLSVYPNPNNGLLNIEFTSNASDAKLSMADLSGKLVYTTTLKNINGHYRGSLDMSHFAAGTYLLTIESEGVQKVLRVVRSSE